MNERDRLDRMLSAWTDDAWSPPPPAYLGEVLARTRHTRQRPAWASLERWLPMELTLRRPVLAIPMRLLAIVLALLLMLIAALSVPFLFGARSLPATVIGEVRNGLIAYEQDGDIWVVDPAGGEPHVLISGPETDWGPGWSPDGTRIAFGRSVGPTTSLIMVADADGSNVTQVTPDPMLHQRGWAWSPDGSSIAIASNVARYPTISIAASDGRGIRALDLGFPADTPSFHPDGSLLVRGQTARGTGLFRVSLPDGAVSEPIALSDTTSAFYTGDRGINDLMGAVYSRDGSQITYIQGQTPPEDRASFFSMGYRCPSRCYGGPMTRNHVMHADGTGNRLVELSPESDYEDGGQFSPDGTRLLMGVRKGDRTQVAFITLDGSRPPVTTELAVDPGGTQASWSPDGTQVLALRWADGTGSLIDQDTGATTVLPWLGGAFDWQPVLP